MRAALLALALGHASAAIEPLDALHAVDDAQLLAEVARRNLAAPQDQDDGIDFPFPPCT